MIIWWKWFDDKVEGVAKVLWSHQMREAGLMKNRQLRIWIGLP
jgi:hypothetical protein